MTRTLATLLRLRHLQTDQASRALAEALAAEAAAAARLEALRGAIRTEAQGPSPDAASPLRGAFTAWMPAAREGLARAQAALTQTQARSEANRAALAAARAAGRAAESVAQARAAAANALAVRKAQAVLDDRAHQPGDSSQERAT